jgi:hypothetical protein
MHIFGRWLFDAVHMNRQGFEEGTSIAVRCLINFFIAKHRTNIMPTYLSRFYTGLDMVRLIVLLFV